MSERKDFVDWVDLIGGWVMTVLFLLLVVALVTMAAWAGWSL